MAKRGGKKRKASNKDQESFREALNEDANQKDLGPFIESIGEKDGTLWKVRAIRSGWSGNKVFYSDQVLRESVPLFRDLRVFAKSDEEHLSGRGKDVRNLIGSLANPTFVEGSSADGGEIQADFKLLKSAGEIPGKLREAHERGMSASMFGFSIDAIGSAKRGSVNGGTGRIAQSISKVKSLDLIVEPGAGGQLIELIEAVNTEDEADMKLREKMIEAIKAKHGGKLPDGLDIENDEDLEMAYREAIAPAPQPAPETKPNTAPKPDAIPGVSQEALDATVKMIEARAHLRVAVAESGLPEVAKQRMIKRFQDMESFTEAQVDGEIASEKDYLSKFAESGAVQGMGNTSIAAGEDRADKIKGMLDGFFDPKNRDVTSFKECYVEITGDRRVTGRLANVDKSKLREAVGNADFREAISSSTFAEILGDSIARRMVSDYRSPSQYDVWRSLASVVPVGDFRMQHRTRLGGYGNLPAVAENGAYGALTSPGDEEATYAVTKRGGTETVSIETIANDDVGVILRIPNRLASAARRTLGTFVMDFLDTNPTIYDSTALFTAGHGNLGSAALSATSLAAGRLAMLQQTEAGSSARLGIPPMNLYVPTDLEETAFDLFRRQTNNDTDFVEALQMNVRPVWYWTDANNWYLAANPSDIPTIEIAFLNGQEEPELFTQDLPTQGSLFTNDQIKYKLRHIYGGEVLEYRGLYGAIVA